MVTVIPVDLPQYAYPIVIAPGGLDALGAWMTGSRAQGVIPTHAPTDLGRRVLLVSNQTLLRHYGNRAIASLEQAGFQVATCALPIGERYKTLKSVQKIYDAALAHRLERSSTLVALGGGVIGDMTGFAAATWLRGIHVVQIPTSLLAMVDAAIGGKTGVNHPQGKNLIGAFHQPRLVLIDPEVLQTLPSREFRAAIAEVIKYGVIWDPTLFDQLEASKRLDNQRYVTPTLLQGILTRSCRTKAQIVSQDEKEAGLRAILNYGHTIGHAIESMTAYRRVNHGEAVALGMIAAGQIATDLGFWEPAAAQRQMDLIQKADLPTQLPPSLDVGAVLDALQTDKKVKAGRVRFILPTHIGTATITDQVPTITIERVLQQMTASG